MTAVELVRDGIQKGSILAEELGMTVSHPRGKLLRPLTALCFVPPERQKSLTKEFWFGCLAIQMVHEASLHHDDVLDGGLERRGSATLLARKGIDASLLLGDLYLTSAYRMAAMTGVKEFLTEFIEAVEVMVRGESIQDTPKGTENHQASYERIIRMKSGALFGIAAALPSWTNDANFTPAELREIGIELGAFYQMVDDFLDYCPTSDTGKPKLQDFNNTIWTFVLGSRGNEWFDQSPEEALEAFFSTTNGQPSMAEEALRQIQERGSVLLKQIRDLGAQPPLTEILSEWINKCSNAFGNGNHVSLEVLRKLPVPSPLTQVVTTAQIAIRAQQLGDVSDWQQFFARNSRSFSFASRFFPPQERSMITEIYVFCRFTDNLVDKDGDVKIQAYETLELWDQITHSAYHGCITGISVADVVMSKMSQMHIPYTLISELIQGMRMDIEPQIYHSMKDLRGYTYRVASVVGDWITQAFGVRDPWVLERAHDLGHAMQLTNIMRDVGEDLAMGRIYLPADLMTSHNITPELLLNLKAQTGQSNRMPDDYVKLLEEIMAEADSAYDRAYEGIPFLPPRLRRPIAIAARVYRGIHDEVRANGYNNLTRRAFTSFRRKTVLARKGLKQLRQVSETQNQ
ncbi:MAG: hypothetical protein F4069_06910 [Rhodothermaceae bacterium]|nr:hypothetical protein [Rhodothermaceae bacterium]MYG70123.1 hypothetical protein [Rhodothermaceae bacterium]MYJ45041.1 hypothetical protein [Rhodothermaceae bacterium]